MAVGIIRQFRRFCATLAVVCVPLLLLAGCVTGNSTERATKLPASVHWLPIQDRHVTVYGYLIYHGLYENDTVPVKVQKNSPFAPWNIKVTEICLEASFRDGTSKETCQKLLRSNRETEPPASFDYNDALYKESAFAVLVDSHAEMLRLKSVRLYGKDYAYAIKFTSPPSGKMPNLNAEMLHTDFIDFGFFAVTPELVAGQAEPKMDFSGVMSFPFTEGLKVLKGGCAAVRYEIPYTLERLPVSEITP